MLQTEVNDDNDEEYYSAEEDIENIEVEVKSYRKLVKTVDVGTQTDLSAIDNKCFIM